ncbi:DUF3079 domain-containing protein [Snodgrassella sp. B3882]|uniref:DUF3079 domain-containing protein n=1 Tax=Snodgrassella sp. B3882 TaxID=2818037 RepID=UPI0022699309|nr:DUF3079 domain-containing protein [Snodgrassella sp. B3882]MCX8744024.1 DUF3079 domain-containing protein [Snodgrassella sp. B3882]
MSKIFPLHPKHPERICWGCDKYCRQDDLLCGNGCIRIPHPCEDFGKQWYLHGDWSGLLSEKQRAQIAAEQQAQSPEPESDKTTKPHIKLALKK